ncbi:hypothetical protein HaLaN_02162 [Haematococcus lacustris]|uniref:Uncharacterized protein n=1 Tax=Haematococcus lacustris TaxID=44745 RepID=A0A699YKE5_HAELA|nr:hypothetical protein HaLaN_02162 [Haematococcus lacustris]
MYRSWAIRAGVQPPAAELALPSMQEAAPHGAPLDLQGMWLAFLRILHHQGHFPQTGLDRCDLACWPTTSPQTTAAA